MEFGQKWPPFSLATRHSIPQDQLHTSRRENLKAHIIRKITSKKMRRLERLEKMVKVKSGWKVLDIKQEGHLDTKRRMGDNIKIVVEEVSCGIVDSFKLTH
jgi:hypothetical protein